MHFSSAIFRKIIRCHLCEGRISDIFQTKKVQCLLSTEQRCVKHRRSDFQTKHLSVGHHSDHHSLGTQLNTKLLFWMSLIVAQH